MTIDLRGLGDALRLRAKTDNATLSALARRAVVEMLGRPEVAETGSAEQLIDASDRQFVKVTIRLPRGVARDMATRAHASGLSHGEYVRSLIDGAPARAAVGNAPDTVAALAASTSELAVLISDLHRLARFVHDGGLSSADRLEGMLATIEDEVRSHLGRASRLVAVLQPRAALRGSSRLMSGAARP